MNNPKIDYYAILDLSTKATQEEIKKQYREMARRYHPDVNRGSDAAQKIKAINEAYHILGDPDRRGTYDAERFLRAENEKRTAGSASATQTAGQRSAPPRQSDAAPKQTASGRSQYGFNGFGRVDQENSRPQPHTANTARQARSAPQRPRQTASPRPVKQNQARVGQTVQSLVADAQMAYVMRRYNDAERLCRQVLALDRRQPIIHEMLGDIYARRGDRERATTAYAYAVQFNPRNQNVQIKLERLVGVDMEHRRGPTLTRSPRTPLIERILNGPDRETFIRATSVALIVALAGVLVAFAFNPGYNAALAIGALSLNLLATLVASGLIVGILMAFYGGMRPVSQELARRSHARSPVDLSTLLSFSAVIWFYASFLIYLFVAVTRRQSSMSVLRAYAASGILSIAFALLYQSPTVPLSGVETAAFAGNLLFPTLLLGWRLGDRLRLSGM